MKIKYSALVSGARGKLNGSVASRNRYGDYFRNKTTPVNAQTTFQQNVRAKLGLTARRWRQLGQDSRDGWNSLAEQRPFTDIFGDQHNYSGFNLFMKVNQQLGVFLDTTTDDAPPQSPAPSDIEGVQFDLVNTDTVEVSPAVAADTGDILVIYAAANYSSGKKYVKNLYKFIQVAPASGTLPIDITDALVERFGDLQEGAGISVKMATFNTISMLLGTPYTLSDFIAAP